MSLKNLSPHGNDVTIFFLLSYIMLMFVYVYRQKKKLYVEELNDMTQVYEYIYGKCTIRIFINGF